MTRARNEVELDLAFLVNGTLDAEARAEVEALLAEDARLRSEAAALAAIREEMQAEDIRSPGEFGLARLLRDASREGAGPVTMKTPEQAPARGWVWKVAAAVALVALVGQTLLMQGTSDGPGYALAGAADPGALVVSFAPSAPEEAIRSLLVGADLEIVGGPSALGLYRLDVIEGGDLARATDALRAAADIVESVENATE